MSIHLRPGYQEALAEFGGEWLTEQLLRPELNEQKKPTGQTISVTKATVRNKETGKEIASHEGTSAENAVHAAIEKAARIRNVVIDTKSGAAGTVDGAAIEAVREEIGAVKEQVNNLREAIASLPPDPAPKLTELANQVAELAKAVAALTEKKAKNKPNDE